MQGPAKFSAALLMMLGAMGGLLAGRGKIHVSAVESPPPVSRPALRIDINSADESMLQLLPRIGPNLARSIIEDRAARGPYRSIEELDRVCGIGPRTIEALRDHATVGP